ncbi:MAG: flavodoxin domain-containing protein [Candidatus Dormibacteria bacterium]|jgi:menaquinone-dependent protoporphyrinogen oxidase
MSSILVTHASRYGGTQGIADRIAAVLNASGHHADSWPIGGPRDLAGYDAFVVGSAVYMGAWLKEARDFVRHHQSILFSRPVWLFSSGPLGEQAEDAKGRALPAAAEPKEVAELAEAVRPRDHQVFFGVLDTEKIALPARLIRRLPAGRNLLVEGDFRDWKSIDAWASGIAHELSAVAAGPA